MAGSCRCGWERNTRAMPKGDCGDLRKHCSARNRFWSVLWLQKHRPQCLEASCGFGRISCSVQKRCRRATCSQLQHPWSHQDRICDTDQVPGSFCTGAGSVTLIIYQDRTGTGFVTLIRHQDRTRTSWIASTYAECQKTKLKNKKWTLGSSAP